MFSSLVLAAAIFAPFALSATIPYSNSTVVPVPLRECYTTPITADLIAPFVSYLSTVPDTSIKVNMGNAMFRATINSTCLQARVYNWSCDHVLNVTGPGIANAVASIAQQCDGRHYSTGETAGPIGFGYYKNLETGNEYTDHLWVVTGACVDRPKMSACSPGA